MSRSADRRHDLDALRVLAVLLLIPFHSARVFDVFDSSYVKNPETSGGLSWAVVAFLKALLRCADPGQAEAATSVLDQIARASSSNATATRRLVGSSTASS